MAKRISTPPMVGVPALALWLPAPARGCTGPSARLAAADEPGAHDQAIIRAVTAA